MGIENNTGQNSKDLEEMRGNAKALKLSAASNAPVHCHANTATCLSYGKPEGSRHKKLFQATVRRYLREMRKFLFGFAASPRSNGLVYSIDRGHRRDLHDYLRILAPWPKLASRAGLVASRDTL